MDFVTVNGARPAAAATQITSDATTVELALDPDTRVDEAHTVTVTAVDNAGNEAMFS